MNKRTHYSYYDNFNFVYPNNILTPVSIVDAHELYCKDIPVWILNNDGNLEGWWMPGWLNNLLMNNSVLICYTKPIFLTKLWQSFNL